MTRVSSEPSKSLTRWLPGARGSAFSKRNHILTGNEGVKCHDYMKMMWNMKTDCFLVMRAFSAKAASKITRKVKYLYHNHQIKLGVCQNNSATRNQFFGLIRAFHGSSNKKILVYFNLQLMCLFVCPFSSDVRRAAHVFSGASAWTDAACMFRSFHRSPCTLAMILGFCAVD